MAASDSTVENADLAGSGDKLPGNQYKIEFKNEVKIGKGVFGHVYKARNIVDKFHYAIKKVKLDGTVALEKVKIFVLERMGRS